MEQQPSSASSDFVRSVSSTPPPVMTLPEHIVMYLEMFVVADGSSYMTIDDMYTAFEKYVCSTNEENLLERLGNARGLRCQIINSMLDFYQSFPSAVESLGSGLEAGYIPSAVESLGSGLERGSPSTVSYAPRR